MENKIITSQEQFEIMVMKHKIVTKINGEDFETFTFSDISNYLFKNISLSNVHGLSFYNCTFENVTFLDQIRCCFLLCTFKDCNFNHTLIKLTTFKECKFELISFSFSIFHSTRFQSCNIPSSNLFSSCTYISHFSFSESDSKINFKYINSPMFLPICPEGDIIGYKKVILDYNNNIHGIAKLLIPKDAKRSNAVGRKCRCDKAKVLSITSLPNKIEYIRARSAYDLDFIYEVGKIVKVDDFCDNRWFECAPGIHFFLTEEEAINY